MPGIGLLDFRLDRGQASPFASDADRACDLLAVVTYGKLHIRIDGKPSVAAKGNVIYVPAGVSFEADTATNAFHEKYVVLLAPRENATGLPLLDEGIPRIANYAPFEWMSDRLRTMLAEWQEQAPYAVVRCEAILMELAAVWSRELQKEPPSPSSLLLTERMKAYIAGHYREKITKEELGAAIGRTPNHAAALFKRTTGQTISEYAHAVRIKTAVYMLKESLLTAGEISEYLGYRDLSYFHRIFKKLTGFPPASFMNERKSE
ncbi:helix-turn-helix domain-containing protein [Cohnella hashimotonis]|uniref:Helix-turn-helix domain-containing protein n=1 Tax=Cohnella hashimotonis TaxID=2826895 RepID=A0ABT6TIG1_9BACL|nr:helix-turn-helix domain-containing protein [Cohnella hashimotonis]MDI4646088.1 helix-turn-helix domain-containing protein [Cohnella hashimotonis]